MILTFSPDRRDRIGTSRGNALTIGRMHIFPMDAIGKITGYLAPRQRIENQKAILAVRDESLEHSFDCADARELWRKNFLNVRHKP